MPFYQRLGDVPAKRHVVFREDGSFDIEGYRHAIRVLITAQEILKLLRDLWRMRGQALAIALLHSLIAPCA